MEKLSQEYLLSIIFNNAIEREELMKKKVEAYQEKVKDKEIKTALKEFEQDSVEHMKLLKDKMIKLNIQG